MTVISKGQFLLWAFLACAWHFGEGSKTCSIADSAKVDCGYVGIDQSGCESKGCCWYAAEANSATPWCYYSTEVSGGYRVSRFEETATGYAGELTLLTSGSDTYGPDLKSLSLEVIFETADVFHLKITDATSPRWEIPQSVIPRPIATTKPASLNYKFSYQASPFSFEVTRIADGASLFKLEDGFTFKDQYLEIGTARDVNAKTFGLGESTRSQQALTTGKTYSMWATDIAASVFDVNLYGAYPFYMEMLEGKAHGAMLLNSNGLDVELLDTSLTFKAIGGIVDLYVFSGSSPVEVVSQYTSIVGYPAMMPYWSFGFHNCKWGYSSLTEVEEVVANYSAAGIPLETQWMDIDYMQNYRDFTYDADRFPAAEVAAFVDGLHAKGQHFVPIVDPGIMVYSGYDAYERGVKEDLFVKDLRGDYYLGQVWPGPTYFPDFFHPASQSYWTDQLKGFLSLAKADGIWIDMNEASNFCNNDGKGQVCVNPGNCPPKDGSQTGCCLVCETVDPTNQYDFPPYNIGTVYGRLSQKTLAASTRHWSNITGYDVHNLYGLMEQIATNQALRTITQKRPFVLSRSSFVSTGSHSAKWTGDNAATWADLSSSIVSMLDFNIFGVPMIGADICGFGQDTTEELCARWIEVGAFYPFARDHNAINQAPQELYRWESVTQAGRVALSMRYALLPVLYTLFYRAHTEGVPVVQSLWMLAPEDPVTLTIDRQFLWGKSVLISPVLESGASSVSAYFPKGYWYDFVDHSLSVDASSGGRWETLDAPLTKVNVHVKGGSVLPLQQPALTTSAARQTPFTVLVALCPGGQAHGELFWDDGDQITLAQSLFVKYAGQVTEDGSGSVTSSVVQDTYVEARALHIEEIVVVGKGLSRPTKVTLNGRALEKHQMRFVEHGENDGTSIRFVNLHVSIATAFELEWTF